jgi:predicted DNA-binding protein with PD1-like motif
MVRYANDRTIERWQMTRSYDAGVRAKQLAENEYLLVFTAPDVEVIAAIEQFAAQYAIDSGRLQAIGSVSSATLAWWSDTTKTVETMTVDGQFELVSLLGNISSNSPGPRIHAHAILTGPSGVIAGHAVSLTPRASVEVNITAFATPIERRKNDAFGLWTIELEE